MADTRSGLPEKGPTLMLQQLLFSEFLTAQSKSSKIKVVAKINQQINVKVGPPDLPPPFF